MFVQAIVTKWFGPTNTKGSRIKATSSAGSVILNWDYAKNVNENHTAAAHALARKFGWTGAYQGGGMPDGTGNVYVRRPTGPFHPEKNRMSEDSFVIAADPKTGEAIPENA